MTREIIEARLDETCAELGDDELRVIAYLATRLLVGQRQYGRLDLAKDARDWRRERAAEVADLLVYTGFEALKAELHEPTEPETKENAK